MLENPKKTKDEIVQWIKGYFDGNKFMKAQGRGCSAVVGISGGKDSTIVAGLCKEALGKDRVLGVLMPDGEQSDIEDSYKVVECLDIPYSVINIGQATKALSSAIWGEVCPEFTGLAGLNIPPRIRMATLYAVAQSLSEGGRVANTCNLSETFVGYATKFGDNVGDFSPLGRLVVSEVKQIGYELDIPRELIDKVPSDGLCGKTDEENMGVTYEQIERVILEQGYEDNEVDKIILDMYARSAHKHNKMVEWCGRNNAWRNFYD